MSRPPESPSLVEQVTKIGDRRKRHKFVTLGSSIMACAGLAFLPPSAQAVAESLAGGAALATSITLGAIAFSAKRRSEDILVPPTTKDISIKNDGVYSTDIAIDPTTVDITTSPTIDENLHGVSLRVKESRMAQYVMEGYSGLTLPVGTFMVASTINGMSTLPPLPNVGAITLNLVTGAIATIGSELLAKGGDDLMVARAENLDTREK